MQKKLLSLFALILVFLLTIVQSVIVSILFISPQLIDYINELKFSNAGNFNNPAFTFKYDTAMDGYKKAKEILSGEDGFFDLILDDGAHIREIVDCSASKPEISYSNDGFKNAYITNSTANEYPSYSEIYYPAIKDSGYAELLEGRWINAENDLSDNKPVEIMVCEQSCFEIGSNVWLITTFEDNEGNNVILPAVVVGIIKMHRTIPRAGKQLIEQKQKLQNVVIIQNPLDKYSFKFLNGYNGYTNNKLDSLYYYEGVCFKIAKKNDKAQISNDTIVQAADESGASVCVNYSYNSVSNKIVSNKQNVKLLVVSLLLILTSIIESILLIDKIIRIAKEKTLC